MLLECDYRIQLKRKNCHKSSVFAYIAFYDNITYIFMIQKISHMEQIFGRCLLYARARNRNIIYTKKKVKFSFYPWQMLSLRSCIQLLITEVYLNWVSSPGIVWWLLKSPGSWASWIFSLHYLFPSESQSGC